ncbi:hypothetical protein [Azospirillum sp. sgz301742]
MSGSKLQPWAVEVLDLRLAQSVGPVLAIAVVQVGPVEIRNVRVSERGGRLRVWLPSTVERCDLKPALRLDEPVFLELRRAVLAEYRRTIGADPWAHVR